MTAVDAAVRRRLCCHYHVPGPSRTRPQHSFSAVGGGKSHSRRYAFGNVTMQGGLHDGPTPPLCSNVQSKEISEQCCYSSCKMIVRAEWHKHSLDAARSDSRARLAAREPRSAVRSPRHQIVPSWFARELGRMLSACAGRRNAQIATACGPSGSSAQHVLPQVSHCAQNGHSVRLRHVTCDRSLPYEPIHKRNAGAY
ncbi:uncharacterized protein PAN0_009d3881 [Moesziomyces antarcticus]|uniref:Uncharacterized protein n=2 Tax=Pseudozyma antarctica TaxID=84753 RepID=A0A5C3FQW0_PSEA2|nr:uncharacterized protein PAN0_009d3881 [Moesziomyces antarcticus]GAK65663.1 hypothetical protein PAN0_009d3881 [Moesziomyces antarcticus]SPO46682.1 uncharacterized protein PSANT_04368 [Moesziomyces antarcticus]